MPEARNPATQRAFAWSVCMPAHVEKLDAGQPPPKVRSVKFKFLLHRLTSRQSLLALSCAPLGLHGLVVYVGLSMSRKWQHTAPLEGRWGSLL